LNPPKRYQASSASAADHELSHRSGKDVAHGPVTRCTGREAEAPRHRVREVHAALNGTNQADVPDAVAGALDALYDLWEYWRQAAGLTMNQAGVRLRGDADAETAAALVHARGAKPTYLRTSGTSQIPMGIRTAATTGSGAGKTTQILARALPRVIAGTPVMWPAKRSWHRWKPPFDG
jgi:hypothetical protein